jgi:hypothetical protein
VLVSPFEAPQANVCTQRRPWLRQKLPSDILTLQSKRHLNFVATARTVDALRVFVRMYPTIQLDPSQVRQLSGRPFVASGAAELSIFCQDVDFTKLFLDLLDPLGAVGESFSVARGHHDRPTGIARYNRNLDCWRTVSKGRQLLPKYPDQVGARNSFLGQQKIPLKDAETLNRDAKQYNRDRD